MNGAIMKILFQLKFRHASFVFLIVMAATLTVKAQDAKIQLGHLDYLTAKASETVDVNIDERLMQLTAKWLSSQDDDEKAIKKLVNGLKGIYVKSFEFENAGEYSSA